MSKILALWATPRSTSTAFEWMMRQRGDFACHHEPFNELYYYGEDRRSQRDADVAAKPGFSFPNAWASLQAQAKRENVFLKDFAYSVDHMADDAFLDAFTHSFLVRDPRKVIAGLAHHWPDFTPTELGFSTLRQLFDRVSDNLGKAPPVMASEDLVSQPDVTIQAYCSAVGIEFKPDALRWEAGERKEVAWYGEGTGPWHDNLRQSTGIKPPKTKYPPLEEDARLMKIYEECLPDYEAIQVHRLAIAPALAE